MVIPETLLPKFVHLKFWLAGLLTRQTIVAFPIRQPTDKWRVLQLIQNDLQLRAQYRLFTGFPLSENSQPTTANVHVKLEKQKIKVGKKVTGFWMLDDTGYWIFEKGDGD